MFKEKIIITFLKSVEAYNNLIGYAEVPLKNVCQALGTIHYYKEFLHDLGISISLEYQDGIYWRVKADACYYIWDGTFMIEED